MKIKANEQLLNEGKSLLDQAIVTLPTIIQNDIEITLETWLDWIDTYEEFINRLDDWMVKVTPRQSQK